MVFVDRVEAGRRLAGRLEHLSRRPGQPVVLGLPRGGVPVAAEVAAALDAPLDVLVVRKLGVPSQPELAMGALGEGGVRIVNQDVVRVAGITEHAWSRVEEQEQAELERRARRFRAGRPRTSLEGRTALVVDDGVATGSTARAACQVARAQGASHVVLATPVAPPGWTARMGDAADEYVSLETPDPFVAIGQFYVDFSPTSDEEVVACLERSRARVAQAAAAPDRASLDEEISLAIDGVRLLGHLTVPRRAVGVVVFAHGSGSGRRSSRNRYVADLLHQAGLGTLLFDLLTVPEERDRANVFDVELLARRLLGVTDQLHTWPETSGLPLGFFGASTGAAAALWAAADPGADVAAVVTRGGRPDLAGPRLHAVRAPTLLVVGGEDNVVLELNRDARSQLHCESQLVVIPGATHLFSEPGTLQAAGEAARDWFIEHLRSGS